ncbi:MAG: hypothetical protein WC553_02190 [Patescibacteria group bacterium]|jgi:hypothetical protein
MKKYASILVLLTVGAMVMVSLSAASCRRGSTDDTNNEITNNEAVNNSIANITNQTTGDQTSQSGDLPDPDATRPLLQQELTKATASIKELKSDVILQLVSMKFVNSLSDSSGLVTNYYIFVSPTDTKYYYMVNVPHNGEGIKRFLMPQTDMELPFSLIPVPYQFWKLSYVDALKLAETNGGAAFRTQHPKFEVSVILGKPVGQYLNWFITYRATDSSGDLLQLSIDAYDGKVQVPAS